MTETQTLDVTVIETRFKPSAIYGHFDALKQGEGFILHNDHDPRPLYYSLIHDRGQIFDWEYLRNGPAIWEVKISKKAIAG